MLAVAVLPAVTAAQTSPPGRVIGRAGPNLVAYASTPVCGPRVSVTIVGKDPAFFAGGVSPAARFFGGVRAGHSLACPAMTRMVAKGVTGNQIMFSAMADRSNDWEAVILGSNLLDAATEDKLGKQTGPSDQAQLVKLPGFTDAGQVLARTKTLPFLCFNGGPGGCEVISQWRQKGSGVEVQNRYRLSRSAQALVSTPAAMSGGMLCATTSESVVQVDGPGLGAEARADMVQQMTERVHQNGRVCNGFRSTGGSQMTAALFGPTGRALGKPSTLQLVGSMPALAMPK